VIKHILYMCIC
jgi:hypothetical protein